MKNILKSLLLASIALAGTNALAKDGQKKPAPNCEVNGKKKAMKDQAACEKAKGKWLVAAPAPAPAPTAAGIGTGSGSAAPVGTGSAASVGSGSQPAEAKK